jgi:hypothetical protein
MRRNTEGRIMKIVAEDLNRTGRPLAIDASAESAQKDTPGFLARPAGAPVYHGFRILDDIVVDGFTFGAITDFEAEHCEEGDAFVIAPDGSRAGLVWRISDAAEFQEVCPSTEDRWGVWAVAFPFEMSSRENVKLNLQTILPKLKPEWERWRNKTDGQHCSE